MAHDFNNLLTVITGYTDLLLGGLPPDDPARGLLQEVRRAGERSAGLTRQLLAFSRQQILAPRVLNLNAVVTDAEKLLRRVIGEDVRLRTALAPGLGPVRADPGQLEQVLLNLCVNARDAMPTGGELTLSTEDVLLDAARARELGADGPGGYVVLAVADTGAGMTDEVRRRLFEPFFTTKEKGKGTGLGLAVVHGIIEQSGGLVEVESEAGRGTTFRVYLPRTGAAAAGETGRSGVRALPRGAETVLLAEDEASVRTLTALILRSAGYTVLEAASGDDALRVATGHAGPVHCW